MGHKTYMELEVENTELRRQVEELTTDLRRWQESSGTYYHELVDVKSELFEKTEQLADRDVRIAVLTGTLERIANRKGHVFMPEFSGPDKEGIYTVTGPGKPELTKQCAHWMRHAAQQALSGKESGNERV